MAITTATGVRTTDFREVLSGHHRAGVLDEWLKRDRFAFIGCSGILMMGVAEVWGAALLCALDGATVENMLEVLSRGNAL